MVLIGLKLFKWGHFHIFSLSAKLSSDDLWPWYMTSDCMNIWGFPYHINKPSLIPIGLQLFNWGHFHIFSLSYNLTSDDLWPWYVTFDLINKWGFPCCIYDPTLVEIHQSMWKLKRNVNPFSRQTTTTDNSGQSDPYVSFPLRQATQKLKFTLLKSLDDHNDKETKGATPCEIYPHLGNLSKAYHRGSMNFKWIDLIDTST